MKKIFSILIFILAANISFAQFADKAQLNSFIRDTIKDRRPSKVTAADLQKAFLGTVSLIPTVTNDSSLSDGTSVPTVLAVRGYVDKINTLTKVTAGYGLQNISDSALRVDSSKFATVYQNSLKLNIPNVINLALPDNNNVALSANDLFILNNSTSYTEFGITFPNVSIYPYPTLKDGDVIQFISKNDIATLYLLYGGHDYPKTVQVKGNTLGVFVYSISDSTWHGGFPPTGGDADSTTFATNYRLDSLKATTQNALDLKLNAADSSSGYVTPYQSSLKVSKIVADATYATIANLAVKADDNAVVHLTGNETIGGAKMFTSALTVDDENGIVSLSGAFVAGNRSTFYNGNDKAGGELYFYSNHLIFGPDRAISPAWLTIDSSGLFLKSITNENGNFVRRRSSDGLFTVRTASETLTDIGALSVTTAASTYATISRLTDSIEILNEKLATKRDTSYRDSIAIKYPIQYDSINKQLIIAPSFLDSLAAKYDTLYGSKLPGGNLNLYSTKDATKGYINFGANSTYDETLKRLGINTLVPRDIIDINGAVGGSLTFGGGNGHTITAYNNNVRDRLNISAVNTTFDGVISTPSQNNGGGIWMGNADASNSNYVEYSVGPDDKLYMFINNNGAITFQPNGYVAFGSNSANSAIQTTSFSTAYRAVGSAYTVAADDYTIDCTTGTFTVTLPTSVGITGRKYVITNSSSGTITIATTSSQTFTNITGTPSTLTIAGLGSYVLQSTGSNWIVISKL